MTEPCDITECPQDATVEYGPALYCPTHAKQAESGRWWAPKVERDAVGASPSPAERRPVEPSEHAYRCLSCHLPWTAFYPSESCPFCGHGEHRRVR